MAVTSYWYANAFISAFGAPSMNMDSETKVGIMLTTNTYSPNQDTHDFQNDVTNELTTANGYTQLGATGAGKILTTTALNIANNIVYFDTDDPVWTSSGAGFTARRSVMVHCQSGIATLNPLLVWTDFGQDETAAGGGTFTIVANASGWWSITATDATGFP